MSVVCVYWSVCTLMCVCVCADEESTVSVGVAGRDLPLNRHPGKVRPSVGWHSRMGKLFRNDRSDGNLAGHRFMRGQLFPISAVLWVVGVGGGSEDLHYWRIRRLEHGLMPLFQVM